MTLPFTWSVTRVGVVHALPDGRIVAAGDTLQNPFAITQFAVRVQPNGAPDLGFGQALAELTLGIRRDFAYRPGVTSVRTTVDQVLDLRAGVCQDFAHLAMAVLRMLARSLPASGSDQACAQMSEPSVMLLRYRSCCSGVPCSKRMGASSEMPFWATLVGAPAR